MSTLLLVHENIPELDVFTAAVKSGIEVINYDGTQTQLDTLKARTGIAKVAIAWENGLVLPEELFAGVAGPAFEGYNVLSNGLVDLVSSLAAGNSGLIFDFLSCNLNEPTFQSDAGKLETDYGVNVRYSLDQTGDADAGGNWVLESDSVDVKDEYFTADIDGWDHVLNGNERGYGFGFIKDGKAYAVGKKVKYITETGARESSSTPVRIYSDISDFKFIATGGNNGSVLLANDSKFYMNVPNYLVQESNMDIPSGKTIKAIKNIDTAKYSVLYTDGTIYQVTTDTNGNMSHTENVYHSNYNSNTSTGLDTVVGYAANGGNGLFLHENGKVSAWASSSNYLPFKNSSSRYANFEDIGLTNIIQVASGYYSNYVLASDGTVYCWGFYAPALPRSASGAANDSLSTINSDADHVTRILPIAGVPTGVKIVEIVGSYYDVVLRGDDGKIYYGGKSNIYGSSQTSVMVMGGTSPHISGTPVAITASMHSAHVLMDDGSIQSIGYNAFGILGNNSTTNTSTWVNVVNGDVDSTATTSNLSGAQVISNNPYGSDSVSSSSGSGSGSGSGSSEEPTEEAATIAVVSNLTLSESNFTIGNGSSTNLTTTFASDTIETSAGAGSWGGYNNALNQITYNTSLDLSGDFAIKAVIDFTASAANYMQFIMAITGSSGTGSAYIGVGYQDENNSGSTNNRPVYVSNATAYTKYENGDAIENTAHTDVEMSLVRSGSNVTWSFYNQSGTFTNSSTSWNTLKFLQTQFGSGHPSFTIKSITVNEGGTSLVGGAVLSTTTEETMAAARGFSSALITKLQESVTDGATVTIDSDITSLITATDVSASVQAETIRKRRKSAVRTMLANNSSVTSFKTTKTALALPETFTKDNVNVVKPGVDINTSTYIDATSGFYVPFNAGESVTINPQYGDEFTVTLTDLSYTITSSGTVTVVTDASDTMSSDGTGYLVAGDVATINGVETIMGSITGPDESSSSSSSGDPHVFPIYGNKYELPMKKATYRMLQGDNLRMNASTRLVTAEEQQAIRQYYERVNGEEAPASLISNGVFYDKVFLVADGNKFFYDFTNKKGNMTNDKYFSIQQEKLTNKADHNNKYEYAGEIQQIRVSFMHSKHGAIVLRFNHFSNPQINCGLGAQVAKTEGLSGMLVREYKAKSMRVNKLSNMKTVRGVVGTNQVLSKFGCDN